MKGMELTDKLEQLLAAATENVRPPSYMIKFYNFVGKIPFKAGAVIFLLTGIDTVKVMARAIQGHTDAAIQVIYQYRFRPWRLLWGLGDHLWQLSYNCRSVRSRGMFTREAVRFLLGKLNSPSIVVSLGSGSASQMLQGIADNQFNNKKISLVLVDNELQALEMGRKNARHLGIEDIVDFQESTVGKFLREAETCSVNLVEMVGLTDYFNNDKFREYLREIYRVLVVEEGFFLGANISSREEASYAHGVACWPRMYYRPEQQIRREIKAAGFKKIWTGQCGLYTVWFVRKLSNP